MGVPSSEAAAPTGSSGAERRQQLILTAYQLIAQKGFEGLRTREIAERVGVNHATLHYHFPTKEDLIKAVVGYLLRQLSAPMKDIHRANVTPLEFIRLEFADIGAQLHEAPEMFIVYSELYLRSLRDPAIATLFGEINSEWRRFLVGILQQGVDQGVFRANLDVEMSATLIMAMIKGVRDESMGKAREEVEKLSAQLFAQLERWLVD